MEFNQIKISETNRTCRLQRSARRIFEAQERNKSRIKACKKKNISKIPENRDELIRKYVYLVNWVVNRLPLTNIKHLDKEDLTGYGIIGLIEAVDRYDPSKGVNFKSFAITRIRGSVYDELRALDWLSRGSRKKVKNLYLAMSKLENILGRYPSDLEIAKELSISMSELRVIQQESQIGIFSLDEPRDSNSEDNTPLSEIVSSNGVLPHEELEENELKDLLSKAVNCLPEREKTVIGLYHYNKLTFKEIAQVMDFSESRASQIHARAISLLKSKMLRDGV